MADWDFDNWVAVCKDCERYQLEIKQLKERQEVVQQQLVENNQNVNDAKNFRELIVNTNGVYMQLSKVAAANQRIKDRNALYQERQRLMLSVISRLTVLIFSSVHYMKLWDQEHKIMKKAIDVTIQQQQQLAEQEVKLLCNEQLIKQYSALVSEQKKKLEENHNLQKEMLSLQNKLKSNSRRHRVTLVRMALAFLEILSKCKRRKLSRKQISWLSMLDKAVAHKKNSCAVRYIPIFDEKDGPIEECDLMSEVAEIQEMSVSANLPILSKVGKVRSKVHISSKDVAVGADSYATYCDVGLDTMDLAAPAVCAGPAATPGEDDEAGEQSPDSGVQLPRSPLSQESECSVGSVEPYRSHDFATVPPSLSEIEKDDAMEPTASPRNDWSMIDHDYHIRSVDRGTESCENPVAGHKIADPQPSELTEGFDAARTSTPEVTDVLGNGANSDKVYVALDKDLEELFYNVVGGKQPACPARQQEEVGNESAVDKQNANTSGQTVACASAGTGITFDGQKENGYKGKVSSLKHIAETLKTADSEKTLSAVENQPMTGEKENVVSVDEQVETRNEALTLSNGTGGAWSIRGEEHGETCEAKDVTVPARSIFDDVEMDQRCSAPRDVGSVYQQQVSVDQDVSGCTDEDGDWQLMGSCKESKSKDGTIASKRKETDGALEIISLSSDTDDEVPVENHSITVLGSGNGLKVSKERQKVTCKKDIVELEYADINHVPVGNKETELRHDDEEMAVCEHTVNGGEKCIGRNSDKEKEARRPLESSLEDVNMVPSEERQEIISENVVLECAVGKQDMMLLENENVDEHRTSSKEKHVYRKSDGREDARVEEKRQEMISENVVLECPNKDDVVPVGKQDMMVLENENVDDHRTWSKQKHAFRKSDGREDARVEEKMQEMISEFVVRKCADKDDVVPVGKQDMMLLENKNVDEHRTWSKQKHAFRKSDGREDARVEEKRQEMISEIVVRKCADKDDVVPVGKQDMMLMENENVDDHRTWSKQKHAFRKSDGRDDARVEEKRQELISENVVLECPDKDDVVPVGKQDMMVLENENVDEHRTSSKQKHAFRKSDGRDDARVEEKRQEMISENVVLECPDKDDVVPVGKQDMMVLENENVDDHRTWSKQKHAFRKSDGREDARVEEKRQEMISEIVVRKCADKDDVVTVGKQDMMVLENENVDDHRTWSKQKHAFRKSDGRDDARVEEKRQEMISENVVLECPDKDDVVPVGKQDMMVLENENVDEHRTSSKQKHAYRKSHGHDDARVEEERQEMVSENVVSECADKYDVVLVEKQDMMALANVNDDEQSVSDKGNSECGTTDKDVAVKVGEPLVSILDVEVVCSRQAETLTNSFGTTCEGDAVYSEGMLTKEVEVDGEGSICVSDKQPSPITMNNSSVNNSLSVKLPELDAGSVDTAKEAAGENESSILSELKIVSDNKSSSSDVLNTGVNILTCVSDMEKRLDDVSSPDITRMIAEFTEFYLLSPLPPDVLVGDDGGHENDAEVSDLCNTGTSEHLTATEQSSQECGSESNCAGDKAHDVGQVEKKDVCMKVVDKEHKEVTNLLEHDCSKLGPVKEKELVSEPPLGVSKTTKKSVKRKPQHSVAPVQENSAVSEVTRELKDYVVSCFSKITEENVRKQEFVDFIQKDFTPFKNLITEALEAIKIRISTYPETPVSCRGTPPSAGRCISDRSSGNSGVHDECATISPFHELPELFQSSSSRLTSRNSFIDNRVLCGKETVGNCGKASETDSDSEFFNVKQKPRMKRIYRPVISSSDSSDEDSGRFKRLCTSMTSLENVSTCNKQNNVNPEITEPEVRSVRNVNIVNSGTGKKNSSNIELTKFPNKSQSAESEVEDHTDEDVPVDSRLRRQQKAVVRNTNKRRRKCANKKVSPFAGDDQGKYFSRVGEKEAVCDVYETRTKNLKINNGVEARGNAKSVVATENQWSVSCTRSPIKKKICFESVQGHKVSDAVSNDKKANECGKYKMPNAKPCRVAHKGNYDFNDTLLHENIDLNLKKDHLSKYFRSNANTSSVPKVKRPSLLKKIFSKCQRKSKIKVVGEKKNLITKRVRKNVDDDDGLGVNNNGYKNSTDIYNSTENTSSTLHESLLSDASSDGLNIDTFGSSELATNSNNHNIAINCGNKVTDKLSSRLGYSVDDDTIDAGRTPTHAEYYKTKLPSLDIEFSMCSDNIGGGKTPTYTEYYKAKTPVSGLEFSVRNDSLDGCETTAFSEYYATGPSSEKKLKSSLSNNTNGPQTVDQTGLSSQKQESPDYKDDVTNGFESGSYDLVGDPSDNVASTKSRVVFRSSPADVGEPLVLNKQADQHLSIRSTTLKPTTLKEGITLSSHSHRCEDSPGDSNCGVRQIDSSFLVKPETVKMEYESEHTSDSDMLDDDVWDSNKTPPTRFCTKYADDFSCTGEADDLLQNRNESETNSSGADFMKVRKPKGKVKVHLKMREAVANSEETAQPVLGFYKQVLPRSVGSARATSKSAGPSDSVILRAQHCAAVMVSRPSSPLISKSRHNVDVALAKPSCSAVEPPITVRSVDTRKSKTFQSASSNKYETLCNGTVEVSEMLPCYSSTTKATPEVAKISEAVSRGRAVALETLQTSSSTVPEVVRCAPATSHRAALEVREEQSCTSGARPGQLQSKHTDAKQFGCKDEVPSLKNSFRDCWSEYCLRHQRKCHTERRQNGQRFNDMEAYADSVLKDFLSKDLCRESVYATVHALTTYKRGMDSTILAISIVRAAMNSNGEEPVEFRKGMPKLTDAEHHLLALVFRLNGVYKFQDVKDKVLSHIVFGMFRLSRRPQIEVLCALCRFHVLLCLRYSQFTDILMFCCDALFSLSYGAFPVVYNVLTLYDKVLLKANVGKEHPLCLVISHVLLSQQNNNNSPVFMVEALKRLVCHKYGYQRGEFMFRDVVAKLSCWLREGRVCYVERAFLILAKKEPWHLVHKEIVQKQLMSLLAAWKDGQLSDKVACVVIRLLGFICRSFPLCNQTFNAVRNILQALSDLLGRPGNSAELEESVVTAVMAVSNHSFTHVFRIVNEWKPLRPVPDTFFDALYRTRKFKVWSSLLMHVKCEN